MTKLTKKQEVIRKAYGEHWDKVKDIIEDCNDGYISIEEVPYKGLFDIQDVQIDHVQVSGQYGDIVTFWRPKSLQGIENNNGWFSIEEHGLPKEGEFEFLIKPEYRGFIRNSKT